ncbi:MAG TPA: biotin/lipoyl-containing protein, partial [Solirubrobacterales bacterium]
MAEVVMPRLSDSMEEGTILQWLKSVGDEIAVGDELVEIETDKANMAYEADTAGTLTEILVQEGETVAIGTPIATVGDSAEGSGAQAAGPVAGEGTSSSQAAGEEPSPAPPAAESSESAVEAPAAEETAPAGDKAPEAPAAGDGHRPKASPLARRIAKERGLDLGQLHGSGPGGRIVKSDVESAASSAGDAVVGEAAAAGPAAETAKGQSNYEDLSKLQ